MRNPMSGSSESYSVSIADLSLRNPRSSRQAVTGAREKYHLSERQACRIVGQPRGTQRYTVIARADEDALTHAIMELAHSMAAMATGGSPAF
jgi:hypothetical protein